ncbi:MAG: pyridine nucleotide-disulfide oxidoreductase, partial [Bacteroidota bacterium]
MNPRILVIGGLAAGPSAASKAKRTNPNADILLVEQGEYISYGICEVPYYVGNVVTDPDLLISYTPQRLTQVKGVPVKTLHRAEEIIPVKKKV